MRKNLSPNLRGTIGGSRMVKIKYILYTSSRERTTTSI